MTISRVCTVGNGQILQWDLMDKIKHFAELRQKGMFMHTRGSAPERSAKFERQKTNFLWEKRAKSCMLAKSSQTDYNLPTVVFGLRELFSYMC